MEKDVIIEIKSEQIIDGQTESYEMKTLGKISRESGAVCLTYDETPATGMDGVTTTLHVERDIVTLSRSGSQQSRLFLEKGKRHLCHYDTGFGEIMIGISASEIISSIEQIGGSLFMKYNVDINAGLASQNTINIKVTEV